MTNLGAITERAPHLTGKINLVAMIGSIEKQLDGKPGRIAEYNVVQDIPAAQKVFNAKWRSMTITPLDTCGVVRLNGELYDRLVKSADPLVKDLLENYKIWSNGGSGPVPDHSSILFDTVAVHLARTTEFLQMRQMRLRVDDQGFLLNDERGQAINVAMEWKDLEGYKQFLVDCLLELR
jgi:inosine-uridine nucleoside N-ribohydrolase